VWAGVIGDQLIGPYLRFLRTLSGPRYLNFLENNLSELLEDVPLNTRQSIIFQHDGAPPHYSNAVRDYLNAQYPMWIGRGGTVAWPPRSPDLTPMDFCVWGLYKSLVYFHEVQSEEELRRRIDRASEEVRRIISSGVTGRQVRDRARACIRYNGGHFEQFL